MITIQFCDTQSFLALTFRHYLAYLGECKINVPKDITILTVPLILYILDLKGYIFFLREKELFCHNSFLIAIAHVQSLPVRAFIKSLNPQMMIAILRLTLKFLGYFL